MKLLDILQPSRKTDHDRPVPETNPLAKSNDDSSSKKRPEADALLAGASTVWSPPPPYPASGDQVDEEKRTTVSQPDPLLSVAGWSIWHGGIKWKISQQWPYTPVVWYVYATFLLAVKPVAVPNANDMTSMFKIDIVEDDVIRNSSVPFSTNNCSSLEITDCAALGKWSKEMVTVTCNEPSTGSVFLKVEPKCDPEDPGIYTIRINLRKTYQYEISGRTRFTFHLGGSTMRPDVACLSYGDSPWTNRTASQRVDNNRWQEAAAKDLPFLEQ